MDLTEVYAIATVIAVIVAAAAEVVKKAFKVPTRVMPVVSLVLGLILGVACAPISDASLAILLWAGGISGLMASGVFSLVKETLGGGKNDSNSN